MYLRAVLGYVLAWQALHIVSGSVISLDGNAWTLTNSVKKISVPATVPGSVHLDLQRAQVIGDPYYGFNEMNLKWVFQDIWEYSSVISAFLNHSEPFNSTYLVFDGLDTFAAINLCGKVVAATNNQFRQWIFDVTSLLLSCPNNGTLDITFTPSPVAAVQSAESAKCPSCLGGYYDFPDIQYIRKQQVDFAWDFAPAYGPVGIWQSVRAVQIQGDEIHVENSAVDIYRKGQVNNLPPDQSQPWVVNISMDYMGQLPPGVSVQVRIEELSGRIVADATLSDITIHDNLPRRITGHMVMTEPVDLWWPVGYGAQTLYNFIIQIQDSNKKTLATVPKRTGFRTVVLDQRPISSAEIALGIAPGNKWNFEINGNEVFCKGSSIVPPDAFWPRVSQDHIKDIFASAVDSNQNMLRVWGGGSYLPDWAYDLADEMGIMLWTELLFADSLPPVDPEFLSNVQAEAEYQVRRLNHHPSIAVWVGNNELELNIRLVQQIYPSEAAGFQSGYQTMFVDVLLHTVFDNTRSISYSPSSVTHGYISFNISSSTPMVERYFNSTPGTVTGNTDYYNYDPTQVFNNSAYPIGRFATEFGYDSMPSVQSWEQVLPPDQRYFNSSVILSRNHNYVQTAATVLNPDKNQTQESLSGMGTIAITAQAFYPVPPTNTKSLKDFASWIYTTQVFQADYYKNQISFYRIGSGLPQRTLGSLYWVLNEMWQTPSKAGLEYDGRWKMVHHIVKNTYEPVIIAPQFDQSTGGLEIWTVSDLWNAVTGTATITWYDWAGKVLMTSTSDVHIRAINATIAFALNVHDNGLDLSNAIAKLSVKAQEAAPSSLNTSKITTYTHETWFHAEPLSKQTIPNPKLSINYDGASNSFVVRASGGVAAWVWLDHPAGVSGNFDNNGFWLLPEQAEIVKFKMKNDSTGGNWINSVTVRSLWDNTQ